MTAPAVPPALVAESLVKRYGALRASDGLDLAVAAGTLHAVIGPNGAGKTTLIGELSGEIRPDSGRVLLHGADVTALRLDARARLGLIRSFQITRIFGEFTCLQNVRMAAIAAAGQGHRVWRAPAADRTLDRSAAEALARVDLSARANDRAETLSHGEQRQLEIAMGLGCNPSVLLLDEPMAGVSREEGVAIIALLASLKGHMTIVLIEHDMEAVFQLADAITVLVAGRAIASGPPALIRDDADVQRAYLGAS